MLVDEIELINKKGRSAFGKFHGEERGLKNKKSQCDLCRGEDNTAQDIEVVIVKPSVVVNKK